MTDVTVAFSHSRGWRPMEKLVVSVVISVSDPDSIKSVGKNLEISCFVVLDVLF